MVVVVCGLSFASNLFVWANMGNEIAEFLCYTDCFQIVP